MNLTQIADRLDECDAKVLGVEAAARQGPDSDRRYSIKTDGSPAKGPAKAKVTVVEFSDFQ